MTIENETYANAEDVRKAKLRTAPRHLAKWRPIHTTGLTITWTNDPDIPTPKKRLTQRQFIEQLALDANVELI